MNKGKMLFTQLMEFASDDIFKWCVYRYRGNYKVKEFTCWKQFLCMSFGQLTHRESMSDTALCLKLHANKLYHLGIGRPVDKSTISRANETRDWRIYRDFAMKLIEQAKCLCAGENQLELKLKGGIYALDSTVVDLCLDVFWWAKFRTTKAAVKINTLLDLKTSIPEFILISDGAVHDVNTLDYISLPSGSYLVMDKAYIDFNRLWKLNKDRINFVVRAKENMDYKVIVRKNVDRSTGIVCDQIIELCGINTTRKYPQILRRVRYFDKETGNVLVFLTNNLKISALTIAALYRYRWGIETFFKWIKQHLKILSFWGQSENAVKTQIWIAISTYVIVIIAKKKLNLSQTLYEILQMISLSPFERTPLIELFSEEKYQDVKEPLYNQLKLF
jgi:IS4 transposase